jgi:hypothetical protein
MTATTINAFDDIDHSVRGVTRIIEISAALSPLWHAIAIVKSIKRRTMVKSLSLLSDCLPELKTRTSAATPQLTVAEIPRGLNRPTARAKADKPS